MQKIIICLTVLLLTACSNTQVKTKPVFSVVHTFPLSDIPKEQSYRKMAYYRTEVKNLTDKPIRIVTFEGYSKVDGEWQAGNILGKQLDGKDFSNWYTEGDQVINGIIKANQTAVCDVNWHGSSSAELGSTKWSYTAVDAEGKSHTVEAIVDPKITVIVDALNKYS